MKPLAIVVSFDVGKQVVPSIAATATATAGPSFVQQNYGLQASGSTVTVNFTNAQTAGNLNVVVVGWNDTAAAVKSVTDSKGNTYALAVGPTQYSGKLSQSIYYASNIAAAGAGANTVTVTFSQTPTYPDIRIVEFSGALASSPLDGTASASGNTATSSTGAVTTSNTNDLILAANTVAQWTTGPGTGFTTIVITSPDGDIAEYETVSSTGSYSATAPLALPAPG